MKMKYNHSSNVMVNTTVLSQARFLTNSGFPLFSNVSMRYLADTSTIHKVEVKTR